MVKELTEKEYLDTMSGGMRYITDTVEIAADIWVYAESVCVRMLLSEHGYEHRLIEAVYENSSAMFRHVLLFGERENTYVVIVLDMAKAEIMGHYFLDLNEKYGLDI